MCADALKTRLRSKVCPTCKTIFSGQNVGRKKYCSQVCSAEDRRCSKKKHYKLMHWSRLIKQRDEYICQECGETDELLLQSHHIESHKNNIHLRYDLDNGITLCVYCHARKHPGLENFILSHLQQIENYGE